MPNIGNLRYIELKSGYNDDGPAWIGYVKFSKSGKTLYFNGHAFQRCHGTFANYYDLETDEEYWISGLKKNTCDRHWAGHGKVSIDRRAVDEYLTYIGEKSLNPSRYDVVTLVDDFPVERIETALNTKNVRATK